MEFEEFFYIVGGCVQELRGMGRIGDGMLRCLFVV